MQQCKRYVTAIVAAVVIGTIGAYMTRSEGATSEGNSAAISDTELPALPQEIAGKPYSVAPGKVPGTFDVAWGSQAMVWKPEPWMSPRYRRLGPRYYAQWTAPGLPLPFNVPLAKRDKLPARDLVDRCLADSYFPPYIDNGWDIYVNDVYLPNGSLRTKSEGLEFYASFESGKGKEFLTNAQASKVKRLYLWQLLSPEELRGEGGITTIFYEENLEPEDTLYLPTVRKMRRLAGAVAKQYFPGTISRYEDDEYSFALPDLNYRLVGTTLFNPPESLKGYGPNDVPSAKRVGDAGDVDLIIEITPKPGVSWWYAKRLYYCGMLTMAQSFSQEYDANGHEIRTLTHMLQTGSQYHIGSPNGPAAPDWWTLWGYLGVVEKTSGFTEDSYTEVGGFNAKVSPSIFSADQLDRQSLSLQEWLQ